MKENKEKIIMVKNKEKKTKITANEKEWRQ